MTGRPAFRFLTPVDLAQLPDLEWLADGLIPVGGKVMVYGAPGDGKTAVVLSLALGIAAGQATWFGRALRSGRVVYVTPEGLGGLRGRVNAWLATNPGADPHIWFVPDALQLLEPADAGAFLTALRTATRGDPIDLLVIDTLAANTPGMEGNSDRDGTTVMHSVDFLSKQTGGAVVLIHHSQKAGDLERGTSVWRGAMDVMMRVARDDDHRDIRLTKMRDGDPWEPIPFGFLAVGSSFVVTSPKTATAAETHLSAHQLNALQTLAAVTVVGPITAAVWLASTSPAIASRSFYRVRTGLVERQLVQKDGKLYGLTQLGRTKLTALPGAGLLPATPTTCGVAVAVMSPEPVAVPWQQVGSGSRGEDPGHQDELR